jgi:hypothetical protein
VQESSKTPHHATCLAGINLFPLLDGQTRFPLSVTSLYIPELPPLRTELELWALEKIVGADEITEIDEAIQAHHKDTDVSTLTFMNRASYV